MPLMPPGNALFRAYYDGNGKLQATYIGPALVICTRCGEGSARLANNLCVWCGEALPRKES